MFVGQEQSEANAGRNAACSIIRLYRFAAADAEFDAWTDLDARAAVALSGIEGAGQGMTGLAAALQQKTHVRSAMTTPLHAYVASITRHRR